MEISDTFAFTAPPEVVFNSLLDRERTDRWLPQGVRVEWLEDRKVRVNGSAGATVAVDVDLENLLLTWQSQDGRGLRGRVRAEDGPAGGSRLHVTVTAPQHGVDPAHVRSLLAETTRHLQRDVDDNFNAG